MSFCFAAALSCICEAPQTAGAAVVGRERKQGFVEFVRRIAGELLVDHEPDVFHAGMDVRVDILYVADLQALAVAGITCMTPIAPTGLFTA